MSAYSFEGVSSATQIDTVFAILRCLNRCEELSRLIKWAERKRLIGPLRCYQIRLNDEERRLFHYMVNYPNLAKRAQLLFGIKRLITPTYFYMPKGAARIFRYGDA